jgi:poly(A) polymerase
MPRFTESFYNRAPRQPIPQGASTLPQLDPERQREFAVEVVRQLRAREYEALWAGGCVRDRLLGRTPKDYDVATTARPEEVREIFGARRTVAIGAAFGVISVIGPKLAGQIEVATFREDLGYTDSRRPDAVQFTTPEADARRRDFTINGLFYDPLEDCVIDFVGGREDLAAGIVRAIGDPAARFAEDKLRLLRAARFAATFGFEIESNTRQAVERAAADVVLVSAERIAAEMRLMLVHQSRARGAILLRELALLDAVLPEIAAAATRSQDDWNATLGVLANLHDPSFPLALAALLHRFVSDEEAYEICRRWKLSNADCRETEWLVERQSALVDCARTAWPRLQRILVSPGIEDLVALHEAIAQASGRGMEDVDYCRNLLALPRAELDPPPLLTGDDLIAHGIARGRQYQTLLEAVRDAQLDKTITTKDEALALVHALLAAGGDTNLGLAGDSD